MKVYDQNLCDLATSKRKLLFANKFKNNKINPNCRGNFWEILMNISNLFYFLNIYFPIYVY